MSLCPLQAPGTNTDRCQFYSHLAEAIPEIVKIINEEGLNEPTPAEEMAFPVADKDRLTLIDDVVALWDDEE